jgi:hypothetical protein
MLHFSTNGSSNWTPNVQTGFRKELYFLIQRASHKAAITQQNRQIFTLKFFQPTHMIWTILTTASFLTSRNTSSEESFRATFDANEWFAAQIKIFFWFWMG